MVHDATTSALQLQLESGAIDMAVLSLPVADPEVVTEPLFDEDRLLIVPSGHPFYGFERVALVRPRRPAAAARAPRPPLPRPARRRCSTNAGYELVPKAEVDGTRLMASLAFEGFAAAIVPASAVPVWLGGDWRTIPIDGLAGRSVGLGTRRQGLLSAPARALRDVLRTGRRRAGRPPARDPPGARAPDPHAPQDHSKPTQPRSNRT